MSYFTDVGRFLTAKILFFLIGVTAFALGIIIATTTIVASENVPSPNHEDHGNRPPIIKGTDSAVCQSGVSSGFACKNVELLARLTLEDIGGGQGADSWGWNDTETGRYYALVARSTGTSFVDITDPESPVYLGNLPSTSGNRPWRDVKVYSNHAFIVADDISGHGMQVFDLTRLRGVESPRQFTVDSLYDDIGSAHNVAINEKQWLCLYCR